MKEDTDKKYFAIITKEDVKTNHNLDYYANNPWHGQFVTIVYGDNAEELMAQYDCEGLFYQLYVKETGKRIGYGIVSLDVLDNDIFEYEGISDYIICWDDLFQHFVIVNGRENMMRKIYTMKGIKNINTAFHFSVRDKIIPAGISCDATKYVICGEEHEGEGHWNIVDGRKITQLLKESEDVLIFPVEV